MAHDTYTQVTYFRTALDPLDVYRLDDIINHGSADDTSTPAAALATHLRGLNPRLRWHVPGDLEEVISQHYPPDSDGVVSLAGKAHLDAAVFSHDGHCAIFVALRAVLGSALSARSMWFPGSCEAAPGLPRATTTGIAYSGSSCLDIPEGIGTAEYLAGVRDPIPWLTKIDFLTYLDTPDLVPGCTPAVPAGFRPVSWTDDAWFAPRLRAPGVDVIADSVGPYHEEMTAVVSAIYQGPGLPRLVRLSSS